MSVIEAHADRRTDAGLRWGVEPIRRVLTEHGTPIAPSTYYDARGRTSARADRDEELRAEIWIYAEASDCAWQCRSRYRGSRDANSDHDRYQNADEGNQPNTDIGDGSVRTRCILDS
ncbi:hypothetical protein SAMN05660209_04994 [Geodermatophilus africanus]|uniref:Uncharacterized protein n=1 Tax=Geodermatophilus africanus TaxID=1137993 RepID=A0A1H3R1Q3_9ACTN|nr:hypothetical protein SAMN05660209_04994 [Geodermatophilus africanus]